MRNRCVLGALILAGLVISGCGTGDTSKSGPGDFRTVTLEKGDVKSTVSATGTLNAVSTVQVGSQLSGILQELHADFNSKVKKGQLLAQLDPSTFQANVEQSRADVLVAEAAIRTAQAEFRAQQANVQAAKSEIDAAQANLKKAQVIHQDRDQTLKRVMELAGRKLVSQQDLDTAQANHNTTAAEVESVRASSFTVQARLATAQAQLATNESRIESAKAQLAQRKASLSLTEVNLSRTSIHSPIDGVVVSRNVDVGQTVAASLSAPTLFVIANDLRKMQIDANVDEADIGRVQLDQAVEFTVDAYPDEKFTGRVVQIRLQPIINQNVVTYDTVVEVDNDAMMLRPGMTANIYVLISQAKDVVKVPNAALSFRPRRESGEEPEAGGRRGDRSKRPEGDSFPPAAGPPGTGSGGGPPDKQGRPRRRGRNVFKLVDGKAVPVRVQVGVADASHTEFVSGELAAGDKVIVGYESGAGPHSSGSSVRAPTNPFSGGRRR